MLDVPLEVPLRLLFFGRLLQRDDPRAAGVEVLHEPLDRAALSRRIPALEHDDVPRSGALAPVLQLQQFDLKLPFGPLVFVATHPLVVRVAFTPRLDRLAVTIEQYRVVFVLVVTVYPWSSVDSASRSISESAVVITGS